jgi:hypothetical protein
VQRVEASCVVTQVGCFVQVHVVGAGCADTIPPTTQGLLLTLLLSLTLELLKVIKIIITAAAAAGISCPL